MVVVVGLLVDGQQVVLFHVDSPNIVYNMIEDNENFDKINQQLMDKMHMVHFLVKMDQYQAKLHSKITYISIEKTHQFMKTITFDVNSTSSHGSHITMRITK